MAVPRTDPELAADSSNFQARTTAQPELFAMTPAEAAGYTALHLSFIHALAAVNTVGARSAALVVSKNTAKANLLRDARALYARVQSSLAVSAENKTLLEIR